MGKPVVEDAEILVEVVEQPGVKVHGPPRLVPLPPSHLIATSGESAALPPRLVAAVELAREVGGHVRAAHAFLVDLGIVQAPPAPRRRKRLPRARREK
jgi:hypothetical protein